MPFYYNKVLKNFLNLYYKFKNATDFQLALSKREMEKHSLEIDPNAVEA